ncbi:MAG: hypothetical protein M3526_01380 [Actinomycetota bacterium]|nr:hypothetical protein [Actinomycetota bacterium]
MRRARRSQRDLFDEAGQLTKLRPELRSKLAPLLQSLLAEAAGVRQRQNESKDCNSEETGDDQDHA